MSLISRRIFLGSSAASFLGCTCASHSLAFGQSLTGNSRRLSDFSNLRQPDSISCGPTCAAMVLNWYGIDVGISRCKTKAGTRWFEYGDEKFGMTLPSGMVNCLDDLGVPSRSVSGSIDDIMKYIDQNRPPILLVRSGVKTWHWVVATGYYDDGARILLSDPAGGDWVISSGRLDAAWTFSADLEGNATGGRRCAPCGGSGKLVSAKVSCTNCLGTGKMIKQLRRVNCSKCNGSGRMNVSGGNCLVCSGSGTSPDMFRKAVETAKVKGHTLVVPNNGKREIVKLRYTIKNDSGRTVRFSMKPSGKSYELAAGDTFSGTSSEVNGKAPTITLTDSGRTYSLEAGNHKFWWMSGERRIGFDRNAR